MKLSKPALIGIILATLVILGFAAPQSRLSVPRVTEWDVRDFGAKGDGAANDGPAIMAAVLAAGTNGSVYFPAAPKFYKTVATLTPMNGQRWYGDGAEIRCASPDTNTISIGGKTDVVIENLFIKHTGATTSGSFGSAISIGGNSSRCIIRNNRIEGIQGGVVITRANDCTLSGNRITSVSTTYQDSWDIAIRGSGSRNIIQHNHCLGGGGVGVFLQTAAKGDVVDDNIIDSNQIGQHDQYGICIYLTDGATGLRRNKVVNNSIRDITGKFANRFGKTMGAGIYLQNAHNSIVTGNHVSNCNSATDTELLTPAGIGSNASIGPIISGNNVDGCAWYGIMMVDNELKTVNARDAVIANNVISSCGKDAILLSSTGAVRVTGNSVDGVPAGYSGLRWANKTVRKRGHIVSNTFIAAAPDAFSGMDINRIEDLQISDNQIVGFKFATNLTESDRIGFTTNHASEFTMRGLYIGKGCKDCRVADNFLVSASRSSVGLIDQAGSDLGQNHIVANTKTDLSGPPSRGSK